MLFPLNSYQSFVIAVLSSCTFAPMAQAQITSDGSLATRVVSVGNDTIIADGERFGNNLFHSFRQFSVSAGGSAIFDNAADISNIFSRVTGGNQSIINGRLEVQGSANLFLLNPSGIQFGSSASLQLGGSFFASTADKLLFPNNLEFVATSNNPSPLTVAQPIGLQFSQNPASILVEGTGHTLVGGPYSGIADPLGTTQLKVNPGQTLALIGGGLSLNGGILTAQSGHIELGALGKSSNSPVVRLVPSATSFTLDFAGVSNLGQINLTQKSLVDVSSESLLSPIQAGSIDVNGSVVNLIDGSLLLSQSSVLATRSAGDIKINASEALTARGVSDVGTANDGLFIPSGVFSSTFGSGQGANISISTQQFKMMDGAFTLASSFSSAPSGEIQVVASDSIEFSGFATSELSGTNALLTLSFLEGNGGTVSISASKIKLLDGSGVAAGTFGKGRGGNIIVDAYQIEITGFRQEAGIFSNIGASTLIIGQGGDVRINTKQLSVQDGGRVFSVNTGAGSSGQILINASEFIKLSGIAEGTTGVSDINASVDLIDEVTRKLFGLPDLPTGNSGTVIINTPLLSIENGAAVSVGNEGTGNAGDLQINANSVTLANGGKILASTLSGQGGNINLKLSDFLLAQNGSQISAEAGGVDIQDEKNGGNIILNVARQIFLDPGSNITASAFGNANGGNITINTTFLTGIDNSDIIARAEEGRGGNIDITAISIFGLQFRDQLTPFNDINASSDFGVSGTVNITNPALDAAAGLVELPTTLIDPSQQISASCDANQDSRFVATGRGGIPISPEARVTIDRPWQDIRPLTDLNASVPVPDRALAKVPQPSEKPQLLEATGWQMNDQGQLALVANTPKVPTITHTPTCARSVTASAS
jgi:filamentous hemagglutinin family protein